MGLLDDQTLAMCADPVFRDAATLTFVIFVFRDADPVFRDAFVIIVFFAWSQR